MTLEGPAPDLGPWGQVPSDPLGNAPATGTPPPGKPEPLGSSTNLSTDLKLNFMQPIAAPLVDLSKVSLEALEHELSNRFAAWALVGVTVYVTQPGNVVQMKDRYSSRTALPTSVLVGAMQCHLSEMRTVAATKMAESRTQQAPPL